MGQLIVIQFTTLDGIVEDPAGADGTAHGGWAMRHGPQGVAGDKFLLGSILETGTLLFGRRTWELFSTLWPTRTDEFSMAMNAATKAVLTHRPILDDQWNNSSAIEMPLSEWLSDALKDRDVVVIGSQSVVSELVAADAVDQYRLLIFPTALSDGHRLFDKVRHFQLVRAEQVGPAVLAVLEPVQD